MSAEGHKHAHVAKVPPTCWGEPMRPDGHRCGPNDIYQSFIIVRLKHTKVRVWCMKTWMYGWRWTSATGSKHLNLRMTAQAAANDADRELHRIKDELNGR